MPETVSAARSPDATDQVVHPRESAALSRRLRKLARVFPVDAIQGQPLGAQQVVDCYEHCHDAYRKHHSAEGAVHMALNDGDAFDPDGFCGQLRRMERDWSAHPPADVLELAFGQGFNLGHLAARHPACRFSGIDLTPSHLQLAGQRLKRLGLANTTLTLGDFHQLPYGDESFEPRAVTSLDAQVLPSLLRLQRVTGAVIRWPWLGRLALARRHPMRGR